jgi:hypothetical protein
MALTSRTAWSVVLMTLICSLLVVMPLTTMMPLPRWARSGSMPAFSSCLSLLGVYAASSWKRL